MKSFLWLLLFTVLSIVLAVTHNRSVAHHRPSPITTPVMAALAPGQRLATATQRGVRHALRVGGDSLSTEVQRLQERVNALSARNQDLESQNLRLSRLLELKRSVAAPTLPARVIGEGGSGWAQSATFDRGVADGVRPRDVVISYGPLPKVSPKPASPSPSPGLGSVLQRFNFSLPSPQAPAPSIGPATAIGQVTATLGPTSAVVLYLTDPASSVAVQDVQTRVTGVARGDGSDTLSLTYLDKAAQIHKGDAVITSGRGGVFPRGLYVGSVVEVHTNASGTGRTATLRPPMEYGQLEEALIQRQSGEGAAP